jgi:hypothetical protein
MIHLIQYLPGWNHIPESHYLIQKFRPKLDLWCSTSSTGWSLGSHFHSDLVNPEILHFWMFQFTDPEFRLNHLIQMFLVPLPDDHWSVLHRSVNLWSCTSDVPVNHLIWSSG